MNGHIKVFFKALGRTASKWFKALFTPQRGAWLLIILLHFMVLARVSTPAVGDFSGFSQVTGTRDAAVVKEVDPAETQAKIGKFTSTLIKSGYEWQPGLFVTEQGISYPRNFHLASFYFDLESDLRQRWLLSRAVAYQKAGFDFEKFLKGKFISSVELSGDPLVKQISDSRWQVEVRGVRYVVPSEKKVDTASYKEKLGFTFIVEESSPRKGHEWGLESSPLTQALNRAQTDGLKIVDYQELT